MLYQNEFFFRSTSFPLRPKRYPTKSPKAEPKAATNATTIGLYRNPPATTVAIAGAGRKRVIELIKLIKKIPRIPKDPR